MAVLSIQFFMFFLYFFFFFFFQAEDGIRDRNVTGVQTCALPILLVSETGTHGNYPGCHISDYDANKGYQIAFPMKEEGDGIGSNNAVFSLPSSTP